MIINRKLTISIIPDKIPARLNVGVMLFMACFITYMLRVNISINIIAMVKDTTIINANNTNNISLPDVSLSN